MVAMTDREELKLLEERRVMVETIALHASSCAEQIGRERLSGRVMEAMAKVPRHRFVPAGLRELAYQDFPLPIGSGKTISQPFMVALMTDLLAIEAEDRILEIGTGLGYQAAVLAELAQRVFSVEIITELAKEAELRLGGAGYKNVELRIGDGSRGWPDQAPFDKIMLTAAPRAAPARLLEQLKPGGTMVLPAGPEDEQKLLVLEKGADGQIKTRELIAVRFSTLTATH